MSAEKSSRPLADLAADPVNPRKISKSALAGLSMSVEEFGDLSGITWNRRTGHLVCGHQRLKVLREAGVSTWKVDASGEIGWIEHPETGDRFVVRIVDWDPLIERAANITANNPLIAGEFDVRLALEQLKDLEANLPAFSDLGMKALERSLATAYEELLEEDQGGDDGDDVVEPPATPISKLGDLWIMGEHRLLCGDSTKPEDVARVMAGAKAGLMNTDPPYGVDYTATKKGMPVSGLGDAQDRWGDIAGDAMKPDELATFMGAMFAAAAQSMAPSAAFYCWHPSGPLSEVFRNAMVVAGLVVHRTIIWAKPGFVMTRSGMYHWAHEPCFYGWIQGSVPPWYGEKNQTSVWHEGRDGKGVHPTQKPVRLFEIPMLNHTLPGGICFEPFSGSGSQIIAGERTGRRVYAMEISPRWVDAAVARWEGLTGNKAHRENSV